jgi:ATP adenylyltransferase
MKKNPNCEFCRALEKNDSSESGLITGEMIKLSHSTVAMCKNQFFKGKFLVIFNEHVEDFEELSNEETNAFNDEMLKVSRALKKIFNPDKLNYASLGNNVPHLHWHIIPRYKNDANWNKPPWPHGITNLPDEEIIQTIEKIKKEINK